MNQRTLAATAVLILAFLATPACAEERMYIGEGEGTELFRQGLKDSFTAPLLVGTGLRDEVQEFGALGVVGGPLRGVVRATGQAVQGGLRMSVGVLDVLTAPFTRPDETYANGDSMSQ